MNRKLSSVLVAPVRHSSLSIGLPIHEQLTGALDVYATKPQAADSDAVILGETVAGYAAVALARRT